MRNTIVVQMLNDKCIVRHLELRIHKNQEIYIANEHFRNRLMAMLSDYYSAWQYDQTIVHDTLTGCGFSFGPHQCRMVANRLKEQGQDSGTTPFNLRYDIILNLRPSPIA